MARRAGGIVNERDDLVMMMFENDPIEAFEKLLDKDIPKSKWGYLLHMCYIEESYESVGGDMGYMENPPINHERLAYLEKLIIFLESKGISECQGVLK